MKRLAALLTLTVLAGGASCQDAVSAGTDEPGERRYGFFSGVEGFGLHTQQVGKRCDGRLAAGRALVNVVAVGNGFGIGAAARVAALATLGLRQQRFYLIGDGVAFGLKFYRSKTQ